MIVGEWRDPRSYWLNTTRLCEEPDGTRKVLITFDSGSTFESPLDGNGRSSTGDTYTINEEDVLNEHGDVIAAAGTLTISDSQGPIITLDPL